MIGLTGTVLLHVAVFQSFILGTRAHKVSAPDPQAIGASAAPSDAAPAEVLVLLNLPGVRALSKPIVEASSSMKPVLKTMLPMLSGPDSLPHIDIAPADLNDDPDVDAATDAGDPAGRVAMFGRYTGQIDARIVRAWRRPRSAVHAEAISSSADSSHESNHTFNCQVRIIQDPHGRVQEVQMLACDENTAWQRSLVTAIFSASPLPAPPNPRVFTSALTMTFVADEYIAGASPEGYESAESALFLADRKRDGLPATLNTRAMTGSTDSQTND